MTTAIVGVGIALVLLWSWIGARRVAWVKSRGRRAESMSQALTKARAGSGQWLRSRRRDRESELGRAAFVAASVAARLEAGADVTTAWRLALGPVDSAMALKIREGCDVVELLHLRAHKTRDASEAQAWLTLARMTELATELGAPLVAALERCARGIDDQQAAAAARRVAFAGPRSSATLLSWLPVGGLALGFAMGVDPIAVLTDRSWGSACGVAGVALIAMGRYWTTRLIRRAERR